MAARRRRRAEAHLEKKLSALQADLSQLQQDLRGLASAGGEVAGVRMADAMADVMGSAEIIADRAGDQFGKWTNGNLVTVRDTVRAQPLASLLFSMGAAAVVSALILRR